MQEKLDKITLENTGFFNYKGGQSTLYNRLKKEKIDNLQELFSKGITDINLGSKTINDNLFLREELEGIVALLKLKYLNELSSEYLDNLNYIIPHINIKAVFSF